MKTKVFLLSLIVLWFTSSDLTVCAAPDTCEVASVDNILPYSHVEVGVRVFTDSPDWIAGIVIPLTWNSVIPSITCDSIHWSDWFWANPATNYSGQDGGLLEEYIDSNLQQVKIVAIWWGSPYLPPNDTILTTLHFTVGEIEIIQPNGGDVWHVGDDKLITWSAQCDWFMNDSAVIDSFRLPNQDNPNIEPLNFSDTLGNHIGFYYFGERIEFKHGCLIRGPQLEDHVKIEYSYDAGSSWNTVTSSTSNDSEYLWSPIPTTPSNSCLIRVCSMVEDPICVVSESFFTIRYCGDVNNDWDITISDAIYLVNYLFKSGPPPILDLSVGDVNCDIEVNIVDVVYLINYLFKGGPPPC